mgnify:CR=1 FL=1|jgi:hypothetical protein
MTQLTEEHFELHSANKDKIYREQKIKFLEDRITTLEKAVAHLNKLIGEMRKDD